MNIFIVYHSQTGSTYSLAKAIAAGVAKKTGGHALLRRIPSYPHEAESTVDQFEKVVTAEPRDRKLEEENLLVPEYSLEELKHADALIIGSPVYYGNMSAATKIFFESLTPLWMEGYLEGKAAGVFATSGILHGGKEQAMLSMMTSLLTLGMIPIGLPFRTTYLHTYGSIFGPTATGGKITPETESLAEFFGKRVVETTFALQYGKAVYEKDGDLGKK